MSVNDNGVGLPDTLPENRGIGLRIMKYRASMIGATLIVERQPSGGTMVRCTLPLHAN